jgi:hypothetical protein
MDVTIDAFRYSITTRDVYDIYEPRQRHPCHEQIIQQYELKITDRKRHTETQEKHEIGEDRNVKSALKVGRREEMSSGIPCWYRKVEDPDLLKARERHWTISCSIG